jgi:sugar-specific transcriptional regulator TrmB
MELASLQEAGLTKGEVKVYLALLQLGSSTIGPILEKSGITKSIIYRILEKLITKGLVSYIIKEKTKHYQAAQPEKLLEYADERERQHRENRAKIEALLPQLILQQRGAKKSEATIYEGFKGMMTVHDKRFEKLRRGDEYFFFGLPAHQPKHLHAYWQRDHKKRVKLGIKVKLLYNPKVDNWVLKDRNSYPGCDARRMPIDTETPAWVLGYKDVTVIGIPLAETPLSFEIVNEDVARSFRAYFDWLWKQTTPFKS